MCGNAGAAACTWLARSGDELCFSCSLTRTRPHHDDSVGLTQYVVAERAKRHVIVELHSLGFPIEPRTADNPSGLAFDLLSSVEENVIIGHDDGLITIDVAESDIAHREKVRAKLDEPYRTMLGHFRHELVTTTRPPRERRGPGSSPRAVRRRDQDYQAEIDRHYSEGPPEGWESSYISTYATMHPYEDFAETFAHYLHINETIDNARQFGLMTAAPAPLSRPSATWSSGCGYR